MQGNTIFILTAVTDGDHFQSNGGEATAHWSLMGWNKAGVDGAGGNRQFCMNVTDMNKVMLRWQRGR